MDVKGEREFEVSNQQLWNYLMDIDVLAKITPGVSKLEVIEEDKYKTVSEIKIGPVKGSFKGKLEVVDKVEPDSFAIVMEQLSKIGNAHVKVDMLIKSTGASSSALNFDGKAKLSGVIARTGQRVLSGVANTITKEVFASLEEHIAEDQKLNSTVQQTESEVKIPIEPSEKKTELVSDKIESKTAPDPVASATHKKQLAVNEKVEEVRNAIKQQEIKTAEPNGFFASIINFFKRLFS